MNIGQLASEIFKFESADDDGRRRMDDGLLVYCKLTLWAFGLGELTTGKQPGKVGDIIFSSDPIDPICPKTLCSLFHTQMMLHIKFEQDLPTGFRDTQVQQKCEIFVTQRQVTPKWVVWFGSKSNSTEFLCLSWSPATLMMIWSKITD